MTRQQVKELLHRLKEKTAAWSGETVKELRIAAGYALACDYAGYSPEQLARETDLAMYEAKRAYYLETGRPRRDPRVDFSAERDG